MANLKRADGVARIQEALRKSGVDIAGKILTSKDPEAVKLREHLQTPDGKDGLTIWQLPVILRCTDAVSAKNTDEDGVQMFVTVAEPSAKVAKHAHTEGMGIHFVASGSITAQGKELTTGDWLFVPAGAAYSFDVGAQGAVTIQCHCCCCR